MSHLDKCECASRDYETELLPNFSCNCVGQFVVRAGGYKLAIPHRQIQMPGLQKHTMLNSFKKPPPPIAHEPLPIVLFHALKNHQFRWRGQEWATHFAGPRSLRSGRVGDRARDF